MGRQATIRRSSDTVCIRFVLLPFLGFGRNFNGYEAIMFSLVGHMASLTRDKRVSGGTFPVTTQICCFSLRHEAPLFGVVGHPSSLTDTNWMSDNMFLTTMHIYSFYIRKEANVFCLVEHRTSLTREVWVSCDSCFGYDANLCFCHVKRQLCSFWSGTGHRY